MGGEVNLSDYFINAGCVVSGIGDNKWFLAYHLPAPFEAGEGAYVGYTLKYGVLRYFVPEPMEGLGCTPYRCNVLQLVAAG